jgi:hypothetical protein
VRAKLVEFRTHLKAFERSAGGNVAGAMAPETTPSAPAATAAIVTPASPAATVPAADQPKATEQVAPTDVSKHLDAITAILDQSTTGALTKTQTAELKKHFAELRALLIK